MHTYPFESVTVNGNEISIGDIVNNSANPVTPFEIETLAFIRDWLTGKEDFSFPTSGSTGSPKTISFTRAQMMQSAQATIEALALNKFDTVVVCIHTKYIGGKMMVVRALVQGMKIICCEPSANPFTSLANVAIDFIALVPLQIKTILADGMMSQLNAIKTIIIGGAPLDAITQQAIHETCKASTYVTFGMTETISHIALKKIDKLALDFNYHTLTGITVSTDDRNCLTISAPYLSDTVITNDICHLHSPTSFEWQSRYDDVINSGGVKILSSLLEEKIEKLFNHLNIARLFFVFGQADEKTGTRVALVIEGDFLSKSVKDALTQSFSEQLHKYEIPREIYFIPQFAITESGKINRHRSIQNSHFDC